MRGSYHLSVTLAHLFLIYLLLVDLLQWNGSILLLLLVVTGIGSLLPDVDATDATILHGRYRPVGLFFKWIIYFPIAFLIGDKKHRGFFHSLEGLITTVVVSSMVITVYLYIVNSVILVPYVSELISFNFNHFVTIVGSIALGIGLGFWMHLYEDALTVSGVTWSYFLGGTIRGNVKVGTAQESMLYSLILAIIGTNYLLVWLLRLLDINIILILFIPILTLLLGSFILNRLFSVFFAL